MAPRDDLDELLGVLFTLARQQLDAHGQLLPVAATMTVAGEVALAAAHDDAEDVTATDLERLLRDGLRGRARAGELRAAGVCTDTRLSDSPVGPTDALRAALEHRDGDTVDVYLPYRPDGQGGRVYGELFAFGLEPGLFVR